MKQTEKNTKAQTPKSSARRRLIAFSVILVAVLAVLALLSEWLLPRLSQKTSGLSQKGNGTQETRLFYDEEKFTAADLADYETQLRDIYYKDKNGMEFLLTAETVDGLNDPFAALLARYIQAIKDGDSAAYAACFSPLYDYENGMDRFASGKEAFPPQRLYDIHIEQLDSLYDEASGITEGLFDVRYRIYKNSGDFRTDIVDDTAPLIFYAEEKNGVAQICDMAYRYGNENS